MLSEIHAQADQRCGAELVDLLQEFIDTKAMLSLCNFVRVMLQLVDILNTLLKY